MVAHGTALLTALACSQPSIANETLEDISEFSQYCPGDNERAVHAEELSGHLAGWVKLVCLQESEQQTQSWYIDPQGDLINPDVAELPRYVRPLASNELIENIGQLSDDASISLYVNLVIEEPNVGTAEDFGAPSGFVTGSSSVGGPGEEPVFTFEINGQPATQQEYDEWNELFRIAEQARQAEYLRVSRELTLVKLHELVELNQWHDWLDINLLQIGESPRARWAFFGYSNTLEIEFTGAQARQLLDTGEGLLYIEEIGTPTDDGILDSTFPNGEPESGNTEGPTLQPAIPNELSGSEPAPDNSGQINDATESDSRGSGGSVNLFLLSIMLYRFLVIRRPYP